MVVNIKDLQSYYIQLLMNTLDEKEHKAELVRVRSIIGCRVKPKRTEKEQKFCDEVHRLCYDGNTTLALIKKECGFDKEDKIIKFYGSFEAAKAKVNELGVKAKELIEAAFKTNGAYLKSITRKK